MTQPSVATGWVRRRTPPTTSEILFEMVIAAVGVAIGTVVAFLLDGRVGDATVVLVAGAITIGFWVVVSRIAFKRLPAVSGRPGRYSVPNAIALLAAGLLVLAQEIPISIVFPLAFGMIVIGGALSDYQWSRAEARRP